MHEDGDEAFHEWWDGEVIQDMVKDVESMDKARVMTLCFDAWRQSKNTIEVDKPAHYAQENEPECIEYLEAALTPDEYAGFIKGNVLKYLWRADKKSGPVDRKKAMWYALRLIADRGGTI